MHKVSILAAVTALCAVSVPAAAQGQPQGQAQSPAQGSYPSKSITMVVPLPAGGTADLLCRLAAERAAAALKQQVVVENRPVGAGGRIAIEAVMRSAPDGHTVLCAPQLSHTVAHLLFVKSPLDTRTMEPVSVLAAYPLILIARGNFPGDDLPAFLAYAKSGKVNYGHQGKGNTGHLLGELLMLRGKFRMTEIPYRGSAPAMNDLLGGTIDIVPDYLLANKQNIDTGKLKILATGGAERIKNYPKVATLAETLPGVYADTWMAVAAPPGTPKEITQRLSDAIGQGFKTDELRKRILSLEAEPLGNSPDEMRKMIEASTQHWAPVIEAAKVAIE
ncbi:MAG TPA: tripartite tricarboxylate transporter substrate binding protein [Xanthobacteraceae bacterium]|nr:tripartite tricarboxylate transporter substrate binding protein [Xanthobacteraceae bacterium]